MNTLQGDVRKFIVALYREGGRTQSMIAEMVGTTQSNVSKVLAKWRRSDPTIRRRFASAQAGRPVPELTDRRRHCFAASQLGVVHEPLNLNDL